MQGWSISVPALFCTAFILIPPFAEQGKAETEVGNRFQQTSLYLSAVVLAIFVFLQFLCCFRFQRRKSPAQQGFSRKRMRQQIGYQTGNHFPFLKRQCHLATFFLGQLSKTRKRIFIRFRQFVSTHPAPLLSVLLVASGIGVWGPSRHGLVHDFVDLPYLPRFRLVKPSQSFVME